MGVKGLSFGQKMKQKKSQTTHKHMTDQQYHDMCLEVTKRIVSNNFDEKVQYDKLFRQILAG